MCTSRDFPEKENQYIEGFTLRNWLTSLWRLASPESQKADWRPREELLLLLKSRGSLEAEFLCLEFFLVCFLLKPSAD